ncbi:MAG TPA: hypothetical protein VHU88_18340 [Sporichthyaceae bacterium]|jgi:carbon monoxide dehydrogenase subunit G|nr:hypothetical protein [Sporichthyaceae bacterium]
MAAVERTFTVGSAPSAVIDYLKDLSNAVEWDPGTESCERTDSRLGRSSGHLAQRVEVLRHHH